MNIPQIQKLLVKKEIVVNDEQAKVITKFYSHKIWDIHVYLGYGLTAFLLFRIWLEIKEKKESKLINQIKFILSQFKINNKHNGDTKHLLFVKTLYIFFYTDLIFMVSSGLFIKFSGDYPKLKPYKDFVKEAQGIGMCLILGFRLFHLLGLMRAELSRKESIQN